MSEAAAGVTRMSAVTRQGPRSAFARAWPLFPLIVFLLVVFAYPVAQLLWSSFTDASGQLSPENYRRIATSPIYARVLGITFKIAFWTTVITILVAYPVSYLIATASQRSRDRLLMLVLLPFWTSYLVKALAWMILLGRRGVVNEALLASGLSDTPLELIYNFSGVMIGMVHGMVPLAVLTIVPVMLNIDRNLMSAANTLGAGGGQAFWRIYFPLSLPGVAAAALLVFITSLGFFIVPALLGGARETMIAQVIISALLEIMNWRFAGALSLVLLCVSVLVFYLYDRLLGVATLSGGDAGAASSEVTQPGPLTAAARRIGTSIVNGLGTMSDRVAAVLERPRRSSHARAGASVSRILLRVAAGAGLAFLLLPTLFVVPVSFTAGNFMSFPPEGLSLRWYRLYAESPTWWDATWRSLSVAFMTAALCTVLGTAAAIVLTRQKLRGRGAIMSLILAPLILPRIITAVALFYLFARLGLVGTQLGLVLGHTALAVPSVVITTMAVLRGFDLRQEQAAWSLGANRWKAFYHVTLPQIRPGLIAAFLFAFVTSFDDLTVALFVSGGSTATLPKQMWNDLLLQVNPTLAAVSTIVLLIATVIIALAEYLRRRVSRMQAAAQGH